MQANTRSITEEARRAQIVSAAIEVLAEGGLAAATFGRIARRAGLSSTGMISYHFADKGELLREVLAETVRTAAAHMGPRIAEHEDHAERLRARIESNVELLAVCPEHVRALREVIASPAVVGPDPDPAGLGSRVTDLAAALRAGQRDAAFGPFDAEVMALAVVGAIDAVVAAPPGAEGDPHRRGRELGALFVRATAPVGDDSRGGVR